MPTSKIDGAVQRRFNRKEPNEVRNEVLRILSAAGEDGIAQWWITKQVNPTGDCTNNLLSTLATMTSYNEKGLRYARIEERHNPMSDLTVNYIILTQDGRDLLARLTRVFDSPPASALLSHFDQVADGE